MTKQELEKVIKNDESVWFVDNCNVKVWEIDLNEKYKPEIYLDQILYVYQNTNDRFKQELFIENIFKTKAEAEHYLYHANVTRNEQLPFLTWKEFLEERYFGFYSIYNEWIDVYITNGLETNKLIITIENATKEEFINNYDLTEANFYKTYDECIRLFRGGE